MPLSNKRVNAQQFFLKNPARGTSRDLFIICLCRLDSSKYTKGQPVPLHMQAEEIAQVQWIPLDLILSKSSKQFPLWNIDGSSAFGDALLCALHIAQIKHSSIPSPSPHSSSFSMGLKRHVLPFVNNIGQVSAYRSKIHALDYYDQLIKVCLIMRCLVSFHAFSQKKKKEPQTERLLSKPISFCNKEKWTTLTQNRLYITLLLISLFQHITTYSSFSQKCQKTQK
ncbi:hypothetical protein RFI_16097 [Reticulomyxa filosa]|uniref:Uncharacterized protein n=1 Tax=Reticulomyxa filosa TaxID=46433 RepID=X6N723_RETFI|nr:hypothetical protein RFI_16097 [Reticulomyxa filosa]|eukprot:ETO21107.1 hypothetical protein RFI_16097 [Reticulomyxa filosa]